MLLATVVVIVATLVQIASCWLMRKKVDMMLWVTFGARRRARRRDRSGSTTRPSSSGSRARSYWAMALAFWVSQALFGKNLLQLAGRRAAGAADAGLAAAQLRLDRRSSR